MNNSKSDFYEDIWEHEINDIIADDYEHYAGKYIGKQKFQLMEQYIDNLGVQSILEVGCGSGRVLAYFKEKYSIQKACGIDISEKAISFARVKNPGSTFHVANSDHEALPFGDGEMDLVILCDIVEHVENPDRLIRESLRIGKHVVIKVPLEKTLDEYIRTILGQDTSINGRHRHGHIHSFTFGYFKKYFESLEKEMGLKIEMTLAKIDYVHLRFPILNASSRMFFRLTLLYRILFPTQLGVHITRKDG